jgi:hypothetical protein
MSDQIQVRFPDKIQVTSPKIDALNDAAQHISTWLHNDLKNIVAPLQVLPALKESLDDLKERLVGQFHDLVGTQFKLLLKAREANLRVAQAKAKLTEEHLEKKKIQVLESGERTAGRYEKLLEQVAREHETYLKQLDSHAYELLSTVYPEEIQARFSFDSVPTWPALAAHAEGSAMTRSACLQEGYALARSAVTDFLAARRRFKDDLEALATDDVDDGPLALPFWFVEVEGAETAERRTEIVFPWDLDKEAQGAALSENLLDALTREAEAQIDWEQATPLPVTAWEGLGRILCTQHNLPGDEFQRLVRECQRAQFD